MFEWVVGLVLERSGLLQEAQTRCVHQYPGMLEVTGRMDFMMGGKPKQPASLEDLRLPEFFMRAAASIASDLANRYPDGVSPRALEIKSAGSYVFDSYASRNASSRNHRLQCFHYLKSLGMPYGEVVYVCRDDCRLSSCPVVNPSAVEEDYVLEIARLTGYHRNNDRPPLEKPIVWDPDAGSFAANWQVGYSQYLTLLYNIKDQSSFDELHRPTVERWNRVLGRMRRKEKITDKNKEAIEEMHAAGWNAQQLIESSSLPKQPTDTTETT